MVDLPTDSDLVDAAARTYSADAKPFIDDLGSSIRLFLTTRADGLNIISIEGTHDAIGWALDLLAVYATDNEGVSHPSLGFIHAGFYTAASAIIDRVTAVAGKGPYALAGHSLGAAMALLLGGLLIDRALSPVKIGAFAPPRVGEGQFVKIIGTVPVSAYIFGNDLVPDVPFTILPAFPYEQVKLIQVGKPRADRLSCHAILNYTSAIHALAGD
jgi:predicted lipase